MLSLNGVFQKLFHKRHEPEKSPPLFEKEEHVDFFYPKTNEEKFEEADDIDDFIKKLEQ